MGGWVWENRQRWYRPPVSVRQALEQGEATGKYPIILADHADNTGGGSPGDSTEVLRTFLELGLEDALLLYGFATREEKEVFVLLLRANRVGPRLAQTSSIAWTSRLRITSTLRSPRTTATR